MKGVENPNRERIVREIADCLLADDDLGSLRRKHSDLSPRSWFRYLALARGSMPIVAATERIAEAGRRRRRRPVATLASQRNHGGAGATSDGRGQGTTVNGPTGPRHAGLTDRWRNKPDAGQFTLDFIERMAELYYDAGALRDSAIIELADGRHIVSDPTALANSIEIRRKVLVDMLKALQFARNMDSIKEFCKRLITVLHRLDPAKARDMVQELKTLTRHIATEDLWAPLLKPV